jgi:hypothetical protein
MAIYRHRNWFGWECDEIDGEVCAVECELVDEDEEGS